MAQQPFGPINLSLECTVLCFHDLKLYALVHQAPVKAHKNKMSLPAGGISEDAEMKKSVKKTLSVFPGLHISHQEPSGYSADTNRYPKQRLIGLHALVLAHPRSMQEPMPKNAAWVPARKPGDLALDHKEVLRKNLKHLREKSLLHPVLFHLLPAKFTLTELQSLCEEVHQTRYDKRNFRKKVLTLKVLNPLKEHQRDVAHKAARYFSLDEKGFARYVDEGGIFSF